LIILVDEPRCLFIVKDDDWDYARSAGVCIEENNFLSIVFVSSISERTVKSNVQLTLNNWFHIVLVQERQSGMISWINLFYTAVVFDTR
jgi:hypothetical protein